MPLTFNQAKLNNLLKDFINNFYSQSEFAEAEQERAIRIQRFKELVSAKPFTEYELSEIIKLAWSTNVWSNKEWYTKQILQQNGIKKLNKYFKLLLNTNIPIPQRYEQFNENIKFLGAAFTTEILCHLEPTNAAIWNAKSSALMRFLEVNDVNLLKYNFSAENYDNFNKFMKELLNYINTSPATQSKLSLNDLLELDYLVWKLYALIPEEYKKNKKLKKSGSIDSATKNSGRKQKNAQGVEQVSQPYSKSYHNELRDKIAQIGQWLGFETEIEKTISAGSRVDVVWEARIANLGRVKYVFEVQHKGSIDSLLINLLKAKKDPTVQKLIVVTDLKQIEQIRKRIADMPESFRESLKFWQDTSVEQAHSNLEELIDIIRGLGLVE